MDKPNLEELLKKWQVILKLQDWDIKIRWAKHYDLDSDTKGQCRWVLGKKCASIRILEPEDFDPAIQWGQDPECTVVHELLHLHYGPLELGDHFEGLKEAMLEQAVCAISEALVERDRAAQPSKVVRWKSKQSQYIIADDVENEIGKYLPKKKGNYIHEYS